VAYLPPNRDQTRSNNMQKQDHGVSLLSSDILVYFIGEVMIVEEVIYGVQPVQGEQREAA